MSKKHILALIIGLGQFTNLSIGDDANRGNKSNLEDNPKNPQSDEAELTNAKKIDNFQDRDVFMLDDRFKETDPWDY